METAKKSFVLFYDSMKVLEELDDDQCWKLLRRMVSYHNWNEYHCSDKLVNIAFISFVNQFDRDMEKYASVCERNRGNIKKRYATKSTTGSSGLPKSTKSTYKDTDTDSDKDTDTENDTETNTNTTTQITQTIKNENEMFFDKIQNDMDWLIQEMNMQEHYEDAKLELFKFWNYWTEKDMRGREKWKWEKTFEVKRRLTTWLLNKKFTFNQPKHGKRFSD